MTATQLIAARAYVTGARAKHSVLKDMSEHGHQVCLMEWAWLVRKQRPELDMLVAIPNGGLRSKATAGKLRAEGVKAGFPDLMLNVPRGNYYGLFIELKTLTGRASPEQKDWIARLNAEGNYATVCKGWLAAVRVIEDYLDGNLSS